MANALVIYATRDEVRYQLEREGLLTWQVGLREGRADVIEIEVTASDRRIATASQQRLTNILSTKLVELQRPFIASGDEAVAITAVDLGRDVEVNSSRVKRAVAVVAGAGLLLILAVTVAFDALLRRRRTRGEVADKGHGTQFWADHDTEELPMIALFTGSDKDEADVLAAAFYEFYETDNAMERSADLSRAEKSRSDRYRYYAPILAGVDSATQNLNYALDLLGPPPEPLNTATQPNPRLPVGSIR